MISKLTLTSVLIISTIWLSAQTNLDSLYNIWQDNTRPDSNRVDAYNSYIWKGFLFSNPDSAYTLAKELVTYGHEMQYPQAEAYAMTINAIYFHIKGHYHKTLDYLHRALKINKEIGNNAGIAAALNNIGIANRDQGNYPEALKYYQQSLRIEEAIGKKTRIVPVLNNIGIIYYNQGNHLRAIEYFQLSLKMSEETGNKKGIASSLNHLGICNRNQGNYTKALDYHQRCLKISEEVEDNNGIAAALSNIGIVYYNQENYKQALEYYQQSLKIREEIGDKHGIATALNNIGGVYEKQGKYTLALEYFQLSLKIREEIGDKSGIATTLKNIGKVYFDQAYYKRAIAECKKSLALSEEIGEIEIQKNACSCLYEAFKALGQGTEALGYHEQMLVLEDSLNTKETAKKLQQMEFSNQVYQDSVATAEKERLVAEAHQEEVLQKNRTKNIFMGSGIALLILAGGLYSRNRYIRKSKDVIKKEKDRSENLLLNILPAEIAAELKEKGKADAQDFEMVSILFTDFKSFTETSSRLSARELVQEINTCFEAFDSKVEQYDIEKIKTIGDAYMAAGGLPIPYEDSVKNTVLAALEMQKFISTRKSAMNEKGLPAFEMRIGIHTGPVVAGIVGVKKFQYDIWGDTVNTASRMESNGEVGKVNISLSTYQLLKDDPSFTFVNRGKINVKGKGEMDMYFVDLTRTSDKIK